MAASTSSCSPSSSAVTIPIPGKSILKRPPQQPQSLFTRLTTKFLPQSQPNSGPSSPADAIAASKPLKRAHFILPELTIVYPISSLNPPSTPTLKEEKRAIEDREAERRRRVLRRNSAASLRTVHSAASGASAGAGVGPPTPEADEWWSLEQVESFYRECCVGCDEEPDPAISAAFKKRQTASPGQLRAVDFSGVQLTLTSASILSDVLTIEWGLRKAVFRECDLDEHTLKPVLHALLIPNSLTFLSVASNRRLKAPAFRLIGAYVLEAATLQFLDLSQNALDKKSVEYVVAALKTAPEQGLESLRLDDCQLRPPALEVLSRAVRTSSLRHISLRHNRINATGAVALALMIRDYPDVVPAGLVSPMPTPTLSSSATGTPSSSSTSSPSSSVSSLPILSPPATPTTPTPTPTHPFPHVHTAAQMPTTLTPPMSAPAHAGSAPALPPPPRHPPLGIQTTYTPYIPRSKRASVVSAASAIARTPNPLGATGQPVPIITSSPQGGVTMRHAPPALLAMQATHGHGHAYGHGQIPASAGPTMSHFGDHGHAHVQQGLGRFYDHGHSAALLDKVRALDALPRVGALRTLDLKGNDLRMGITYIAQVLKRNRTLKVLNLSENKLDVAGLVAIAEALKYNSCLETLDLSKNPCCGPGLDGVQALRTAFTLNASLKRLFLSSTGMTSAGAIALAEFLPESASLLHLDLTLNSLDLAAVMALSSGLKANHVMRCLDLNIPPDDEEFAKMCREILSSCVRNTEEAERSSHVVQGANGDEGAKMLRKGVWNMIEESELAKSIRLEDEAKMEASVTARAKACVVALTNAVASSKSTPASLLANGPASRTAGPASASVIANVSSKAKSLVAELAQVIQETEDPHEMEELLRLNDQVTELLARLPSPPVRPTLTLRGLGFHFSKSPVLSPASVTMANGIPNGHAVASSPAGSPGPSPNVGVGVGVGFGAGGTSMLPPGDGEEEEGTPTTPRVDKGKARAEPEPEKVLSPTFLIDEEESEDEGEYEEPMYDAVEGLEDATSPTDRSRSWVAEEGEVFRKGTVLLGPEEMEGEYAGEELRRELLEAMVERPPPRPLTDEFGLEVTPEPARSPTSSPNLASPSQQQHQQQQHQQAEPTKPPPRPYISRSRSSSNSIISVVAPMSSPVTAGGAGVPVPVSPSILEGVPMSLSMSMGQVGQAGGNWSGNGNGNGSPSPRIPSSPASPTSPSRGLAFRPFLSRSRSSSGAES